MKVFMADEVELRVIERTVPDMLMAPPIDNQPDTLDSADLMAAIEGFMAGYDIGHNVGFVVGQMGPLTDREELKYEAEATEQCLYLDDPEYPNKRKVTEDENGTIMLTGNYGRNKEYVMAVNRSNPELARQKVYNWIKVQNGE